jgi:hypothetical protein
MLLPSFSSHRETMRTRSIFILTCLLLMVTGYAAAQQTAAISLNAPSLQLQTGQTYDITIRVDNSPDMWLADVEIGYDDSALYVFGTRSGSPVIPAGDFAGTGTVSARNSVQGGTISYTISKAGEVAPVPGNSVIGTFRIYPLKAGTTRLLFKQADLRMLNAAQDGTDPITITPVLLELTITGDTVDIPEEATATPLPTETPVSGIAAQPTRAAEATLANATAAPGQPTPVPAAESSAGTSPVLLIAIGLMVLAAIVLIGMFMYWRRNRR